MADLGKSFENLRDTIEEYDENESSKTQQYNEAVRIKARAAREEFLESLPETCDDIRTDIIERYIAMGQEETFDSDYGDIYIRLNSVESIENQKFIEIALQTNKDGDFSFNTEQLNHLCIDDWRMDKIIETLSQLDNNGDSSFDAKQMQIILDECNKENGMNIEPFIQLDREGKTLISAEDMETLREARDKGLDTSDLESDILDKGSEEKDIRIAAAAEDVIRSLEDKKEFDLDL